MSFLYLDILRSSDVRTRKISSEKENKDTEHLAVASTVLDKSKMATAKNSDIGMLAPKPILFLSLWYFFSGLTLFFNKYIVATMHGSETLLGMWILTWMKDI